jgi:hypothetical protein
MYRQPETLGDPKPIKPPRKRAKRIKPVAEKRSKELDLYKKCRKIHLEDNPNCVRCGGIATDIHHAKGKENEMLIKFQWFKSVCRPCHDWIHDNPIEAIENGYSEFRNR